MSELTTEMCAFPGCERPVAPAAEGAGRPSRYCERPSTTRRARSASAAAAPPPASSTAATARAGWGGPSGQPRGRDTARGRRAADRAIWSAPATRSAC